MKKIIKTLVRNKELIINFVFVFISLIITLVMFRGGNILGGGEVGAAFYSPYRIFEMIKYSWSNVHLGITSGLMPASAPFFGFLGLFQYLGVSPVLIQATFFFFVIYLTLVSMFYLAKTIFPKLGNTAWFLAATFYMFNPYVTFNIWNRFLPNTMLFYALIPLCTFIFVRGIQKKSFRYTAFLAIIMSFGSYAFSAPAQTLIFWGILFVTGVYELIHGADNKFVTKYFVLLFFLWTFTNYWWISQQFSFAGSSTYSESTQQFFTNAGNISTFVTLSKSLGQFQDLLVFSHGRISHEVLNYPFNWPLVYSSPVYTIFAWIVLISSLFIIFKYINRRYISYLLSLFVLGIFMSKGNLPPFGIIFYKAFEKFFFLQFFRNPFEKIGYLTVFSFSLIFAYGFAKLSRVIIQKKAKAVLTIFVFSFIFLLNGFPFFTGLVFTGDLYPSNDPNVGIQVKIPRSYKNANDFLQSSCPICRYIAMPLGLGEGIYYNWEKGYVGLEQSGFLMQNPGISHNTTLPYYGAISSQLEALFLTQESFDKVSRMLNAPFIIIRDDIDYMRSKMRNPQVIAQRANQFEKEGVLDHLQTFDNLSVYKFSNGETFKKIYPASGITLTTDTSAYDQIYYTNFRDNEVLYPFGSFNLITGTDQNISSTVLKSEAVFESVDNNYLKYSEEAYIFPFVQTLATSPKYPLILLKERAEGILKFDIRDKVYWDMLLLGKRLKEVQLSDSKSDLIAGKKSLDNYTKNLPKVFDELKVLNFTFKKSGERIWKEEEIVKLFSSHLYVLTQLESSRINSDSSITDAKKMLLNLASSNNTLPYWSDPNSGLVKNQNVLTYKVTVPADGEYEMFLPTTEFFPYSFFEDEMIPIKIDDKLEKYRTEVSNSQLSLGKRNFSKGVHEISINEATSVNLVDTTGFVLEAKSENDVREILISSYSAFTEYKISFDFDIEYGSALNFSVKNDNDFIEKDSGYYFRKTFQPDNYYFGENHFETNLKTYPLSTSANLVFQISPWNNCTAVFNKNKSKCKNMSTYNVYNKPTKIVVNNLKVQPKLPRSLYLVQEKIDNTTPLPTLDYTMVNPTKYKVRVSEADKPYLLVFSESFDSRWRIKNLNTNKNISDNKHIMVNGYANAWWIDNPGNYEVEIYFESQEALNKGYLISGMSTLFLIVLLVTFKKYFK